MITFCNINELKAAREALKDLEKDHQTLYEKLVEVVYLTRALNFKYHYMGTLLMDENPEPYTPSSVHESVLQLYQTQLQKLKNNQDFQALKQILAQFKDAGYANISHLLLGTKPESLVGASYSK